ncbi:MAG TPA: hypothetical protein VMV18_08425, partial [bacterium]|nr:hypothetical protein [bacterium]
SPGKRAKRPAAKPRATTAREAAALVVDALLRTAGADSQEVAAKAMENFQENADEEYADVFYVVGTPDGGCLVTSGGSLMFESPEQFWEAVDEYACVELHWWCGDRKLDGKAAVDAMKPGLFRIGRDGVLSPLRREDYPALRAARDARDRRLAYLDRSRPDAELLDRLAKRVKEIFRGKPPALRFAE